VALTFIEFFIKTFSDRANDRLGLCWRLLSQSPASQITDHSITRPSRSELWTVCRRLEVDIGEQCVDTSDTTNLNSFCTVIQSKWGHLYVERRQAVEGKLASHDIAIRHFMLIDFDALYLIMANNNNNNNKTSSNSVNLMYHASLRAAAAGLPSPPAVSVWWRRHSTRVAVYTDFSREINVSTNELTSIICQGVVGIAGLRTYVWTCAIIFEGRHTQDIFTMVS